MIVFFLKQGKSSVSLLERETAFFFFSGGTVRDREADSLVEGSSIGDVEVGGIVGVDDEFFG